MVAQYEHHRRFGDDFGASFSKQVRPCSRKSIRLEQLFAWNRTYFDFERYTKPATKSDENRSFDPEPQARVTESRR